MLTVEPVHRRRQIDLSLLAEPVGEIARLLEHEPNEPAHRGRPEGRKQKPELLAHDLRRHVVCNAASEDGYRELVDGLRIQLVVRRPEVEVVSLRSDEKDQIPRTEPQAKDLAMVAPAAVERGDRILLKLRQVAEQRPPSGKLWNRSRVSVDHQAGESPFSASVRCSCHLRTITFWNSRTTGFSSTGGAFQLFS